MRKWSIDVNVVHACSSKRPAAHVSLSWNFLRLLTSCLPDSFCFSIASLRCRLLSFCYVTDDMESRSQGQCSAKHDGTREPIQTTEKWRWKCFSELRAERSSLRASIYCLRQCLYHSKIPRASAARFTSWANFPIRLITYFLVSFNWILAGSGHARLSPW